MEHRPAERTAKTPGTAAAILLTAALLLFFTASCTVRQQVDLEREGRGTASVEAELHPMAVRYITDLIVFSGGPEPESIFDPAAIDDAFDAIPELSLQDLEITGPGSVRLDFAFTDVESLFLSQVGEDVPPAAQIRRKKSGSQCLLYLDRENYAAIVTRVLTLSGMIVFEDYLTGLLEPGPEDVILDMYEYAFEEYTEDSSVREVLEESEILLEFEVPEKVLSHRSGTISGGEEGAGEAGTGGIRYSISLLDILTLEEPISYSFLFR